MHLAPFNQVARKLLDEIPFTADEPIQTPETELTGTMSPAAETAVQEEPLLMQSVDEPQPAAEITTDVPAVEESAHDTGIAEAPPTESAELPSVDDYIQQHAAIAGSEKLVSLDEYLDHAAAPEPTGFDALTAQLENAGRIIPQEPEPGPSSEENAPLDSIVITPTLAEIYASQGEYGAAIQAYEILIYSKPNERERFEKRISELQAKLNEGG